MDSAVLSMWRGSDVSRRFWIIFALWSLYGVFNTIVVHTRSLLYGKPMSWTECALYEISYVWVWAAVTPLVLMRGAAARSAFRTPAATPRSTSLAPSLAPSSPNPSGTSRHFPSSPRPWCPSISNRYRNRPSAPWISACCTTSSS